jgi:hypothetical protein
MTEEKNEYRYRYGTDTNKRDFILSFGFCSFAFIQAVPAPSRLVENRIAAVISHADIPNK